jgi:hypothetical protein
VEGSYEGGSETSGSIKRWEILEWLHNCQLPKKGPAPWASEWVSDVVIPYYSDSTFNVSEWQQIRQLSSITNPVGESQWFSWIYYFRISVMICPILRRNYCSEDNISAMYSVMALLNTSSIKQSLSTQISPHRDSIGKSNVTNCLLERMNRPQFKKLLLKSLHYQISKLVQRSDRQANV